MGLISRVSSRTYRCVLPMSFQLEQINLPELRSKITQVENYLAKVKILGVQNAKTKYLKSLLTETKQLQAKLIKNKSPQTDNFLLFPGHQSFSHVLKWKPKVFLKNLDKFDDPVEHEKYLKFYEKNKKRKDQNRFNCFSMD